MVGNIKEMSNENKCYIYQDQDFQESSAVNAAVVA